MSKKQAQDPGAKKVATVRRQLTRTSKKSAVRDLTPETATLVLDIGKMIETARAQVAQTANAALTTLYWQIGDRIRQDVLKERRARYGAEIVSALGRQLEAQFGRGFGENSLGQMLLFAEAYPDFEIVSALRRRLSWAHFRWLTYLDDPLDRDF